MQDCMETVRLLSLRSLIAVVTLIAVMCSEDVSAPSLVESCASQCRCSEDRNSVSREELERQIKQLVAAELSKLTINLTLQQPTSESRTGQDATSESSGQDPTAASSGQNSTSEHPPSSEQPTEAPPNGGWKLEEEATRRRLESGQDGHPMRCSIDRLFADEFSDEEFNLRYRNKQPVIIRFRNGASDWTRPHRWSMSHLLQVHGNRKIGVGISRDIPLNGGNPDSVVLLGDYLLRGEEKEDHGGDLEDQPYLLDRQLFTAEQLSSQIRIPSYLNMTDDDDVMFFLGRSLTGVTFHRHREAWNGVVFGRKRWFVYPPDKTPPGGVPSSYGSYEWFDRVYPTLSPDNAPLECVQEAGDIFFVPEYFYHMILNIGDTVAVSLQKQPAQQRYAQLLEDVFSIKELIAFAPPLTAVDLLKLQLALLEEALRITPENLELQLHIGDVSMRQGRLNDSLRWATAATEKDPLFTTAFAHLAANNAKLGNNSAAETFYQRAMLLSPLDHTIPSLYSRFLIHQRRYTDAIPVLEELMKMKPSLEHKSMLATAVLLRN